MKKPLPIPVLLVGAGRMGSALLRGWLKKDVGPITIAEPYPSNSLLKFLHELRGEQLELKVRPSWGWPQVVPSVEQLPSHDFAACVVAIKPQTLKVEAKIMRSVANSGALMISIAAGISSETLADAWGANAHIVRAMPNTPGAIGKGITGIYAARNVSDKDMKLADRLLSALGRKIWLDEEGLINVVTAISGSGPAYLFLLTEALTDIGVDFGLSRTTAAKLARATVTGAGAILDNDTLAPSSHRKAVTSKKGTTEAALDVLQGKDHRLFGLLFEAVKAAKDRAEELAKPEA